MWNLWNNLVGKEPKETEYPQNVPFTDDDPCANCEEGCDHPQLPSTLEKTIEYTKPLTGTVKPYSLHICIFEGTSTDWPERIEKDYSTTTGKLLGLTFKLKTDFRIIVSAIDISNTPSNLHISDEQASGKGVDLMIFPHKWILRGVKTDQLEKVLQDLVDNMAIDENIPVEKMNENEVFVLICTHKKRDKRCGVAGPLLLDEFNAALKELKDDLKGSEVHLCGISHFGGHKFAGNLILYAPKAQGVWYGRVKTCHVRPILQDTVLEGKIFKSLWRGQITRTPTLAW